MSLGKNFAVLMIFVSLLAGCAWTARPVIDQGEATAGGMNRGPLENLKNEQEDFGNNHALVIGNSHYTQLPPLATAAADAKGVTRLLNEKYGFNTNTLIDATRGQVLAEIHKLQAKLTEEDNLLIYYVGHSMLVGGNGHCYWLPVDAESDNATHWLSTDVITDILSLMAARHVLVVTDS